MNLTWKYNYSNLSLKLFDGHHQVGFLKANIWTPYFAQGQLNGTQYVFKSRNFFFGKTQIINAETNEIEGYIYGVLHPVIKLGSEQATKLNFKNPWMTKWRLVGNQSYRVQFDGGYFNGKFSWIEGVPSSLILAAFYARNKVWEIGFFMLVVLVIWLISRVW